MQTLMLFYAVASLVLAALALPLIAGRVRPNPFYGYRVRATLDDPQVWVSANRYFGKRQLVVALVTLLGSLAFYAVPGISLDAYALSVLAVFALAFGAAVVQSWRYVRSL